ncbi:DUF2793 domain-containing protein [Altererythrobacter indicus]|uniref:DUF2793 domain-containing protein n=1 Tax=Altericroceibacterium indicum TaxID=374177 RepID=A0A845A921_9SPHN|nr:DUF2793 domain-containing protein [Altericroceibacterium indicum]MXP26872.1 DUF2793 domain-containing protein [Altericroceibacterium indicum]
MPDPISFTSASPRFGLPLLFAGQTQKEFFVNEAHCLTDALLHPAIEGEQSAPPSAPEEGQCWLVSDTASGEWSGHDSKLVCWQAGAWLFITPREGMAVFDKTSNQMIRFAEEWKRPETPALPIGGANVDSEARAAISGLIAGLIEAGIFPDS